MKEKVSHTIDEDLMKEFRIYCKENGMKLSTKIESLIRGELRK